MIQKIQKHNKNENENLLEYQTPETKSPCLPLSMILLAFHISHSINTKRHIGSGKVFSNFNQNFYFPNAPIWIKRSCNDYKTCHLNKPYPHQKQLAEKQGYEGQS